jgi:uncharacterized protein YndB with AHSA1/START domain
MKRDLRLERHFAHAPERVWRALTDPRALAQWLMENDFEPRVGHKFRFRDRPRPGWNGITECEVLECDPPRRLSYTFTGGPLNSVVTWTLTPAGAGTRLVLEHTGLEGLFPMLLSFMFERGWGKMLDRKLPAVLARMTADAFTRAAPEERSPSC